MIPRLYAENESTLGARAEYVSLFFLSAVCSNNAQCKEPQRRRDSCCGGTHATSASAHAVDCRLEHEGHLSGIERGSARSFAFKSLCKWLIYMSNLTENVGFNIKWQTKIYILRPRGDEHSA